MMALRIERHPQYGEIQIEDGIGTIKRIDGAPDRRNRQVIIDADHLHSFPVTGWFDTTDRAMVEKAKPGQRVYYRIAVRQKLDKRGQPIEGFDVPIDQVGNLKKVREVAVLTDPDPADAAAAAQQQRQAPPQAPPRRSVGPAEPGPIEPPPCDDCGRTWDCSCPPPAVPKQWTPGADPAAEEALEALEKAARARTANLPTPALSPGANVAPQNRQPDPAPTPMPGRRPRVAEAKPWELFNSDGSINLGSYAFQAEFGFVTLAYEQLCKRASADVASHGGQYVAPSAAKVKTLARALLAAADKCQALNREDGHDDRMDNSHTRARGAVRAALDSHPVPWGASPAERARWVDALAEAAAALMAVTVEIHREHYPVGEAL